MIITQIIGGLGNQMFQYAAGRCLSIKRGTQFKLDISGFADYSLHQGFELKRVFDCPAESATKADIHSILGWQSCATVRKILSRPNMVTLRRKSFVVEPHFNYWQDISAVPLESYLSGYWQSEKYFFDVAPTIRADFVFRNSLNSLNVELARNIQRENAISLHVRRGDYVNNPKTTATHGLCSLEYYQSAVQYVISKIDQPSFYIFSDDPTWVRENITIDFPCRYVDHNRDAESYNDMRLMSMCKHHIIANSSFSWWGAWLNPDPSKIVVAPRKWFANNSDVSDLFPPGWVTL